MTQTLRPPASSTCRAAGAFSGRIRLMTRWKTALRGPANHNDYPARTPASGRGSLEALRLRRLRILQGADGKTFIQEVREQGNELLAG